MEGVRKECQHGIQATYNGELEVRFSPLVDVEDPPLMRSEVVRRQANDLDVALLEIGSTARHFRKLGGAYRSEVVGVRKEDGLGSSSASVN